MTTVAKSDHNRGVPIDIEILCGRRLARREVWVEIPVLVLSSGWDRMRAPGGRRTRRSEPVSVMTSGVPPSIPACGRTTPRAPRRA
jgi:hypothetical protein